MPFMPRTERTSVSSRSRENRMWREGAGRARRRAVREETPAVYCLLIPIRAQHREMDRVCNLGEAMRAKQ